MLEEVNPVVAFVMSVHSYQYKILRNSYFTVCFRSTARPGWVLLSRICEQVSWVQVHMDLLPTCLDKNTLARLSDKIVLVL